MFSETTTSIDLKNILISLYPKYDCHVIAVDQIKTIKPQMNQIIICNLQTSKDKGSHWVLCLCVDKRFVEYMDTFAVPPDDRVLSFLRQFKNNNIVDDLIMTTKIVQNFKNSWCGWGVLIYTNFRIKKHEQPYIAINNMNDKNIVSYVRSLTKKYI